MRSRALLRGLPRLFYGWWIVAAGFLLVGYGQGVDAYVSRSSLTFFRQEFGAWTSVDLVFASVVVVAVAPLAIGPLIDRYGPRRSMFAGIPLAAVAILALRFVGNPVAVYILLPLPIGVGMVAGFLLPTQTATANWFVRRRCIALAVISAASVLGGALLIAFQGQMAADFDWRGLFLWLGLGMLVVGVPLAMVMRHRPEDHGYLPDGASTGTGEIGPAAAADRETVGQTDFSVRQALRTRAFWMLAVAVALSSGVTTGMPLNALLHVDGFDREVVSHIFQAVRFMGLAGILAFGFLGDMFPKRYLLAIAVVLQGASALILLAGPGTAQTYLYALVAGLGSGTVPLMFAIRADYFGRRAFATIAVAMMFISGILAMPVTSGVTAFGGWVTGGGASHVFALLLPLAVGLAAAVVFFFSTPPARADQTSPAS